MASNLDGPLASYRVLVCSDCGAGRTDPLPTPERRTEAHDRGVYEVSGGRIQSLVGAALRRLDDRRLRGIRSLGVGSGRIVDLGCGKGRFLSHAALQGFSVVGTDPSPTQVRAARERYGLEVFAGQLWDAGLDAASVDAVTAWHVMEHLTEPDRTLQEIHRVLRPGGVFVCEVPNFASWQSVVGGPHWFQLDPPRHLSHLTLLALRRMLERHGLRPCSVGTFALDLGPFGMLQSALNRAGLEPNGLFRWLKRAGGPRGPRLLAHLGAAAVLAVPSLVAELAATAVRSGGVLRVAGVRSPSA
jgi:SAM-dependent methyltransferase